MLDRRVIRPAFESAVSVGWVWEGSSTARTLTVVDSNKSR